MPHYFEFLIPSFVKAPIFDRMKFITTCELFNVNYVPTQIKSEHKKLFDFNTDMHNPIIILFNEDLNCGIMIKFNNFEDITSVIFFDNDILAKYMFDGNYYTIKLMNNLIEHIMYVDIIHEEYKYDNAIFITNVVISYFKSDIKTVFFNYSTNTNTNIKPFFDYVVLMLEGFEYIDSLNKLTKCEYLSERLYSTIDKNSISNLTANNKNITKSLEEQEFYDMLEYLTYEFISVTTELSNKKILYKLTPNVFTHDIIIKNNQCNLTIKFAFDQCNYNCEHICTIYLENQIIKKCKERSEIFNIIIKLL